MALNNHMNIKRYVTVFHVLHVAGLHILSFFFFFLYSDHRCSSNVPVWVWEWRPQCSPAGHAYHERPDGEVAEESQHFQLQHELPLTKQERQQISEPFQNPQ